MAYEIPHGRSLDTDFMFTKLLVDDLEKAAAFYASGPLFVLAKFKDAPKPANDEVILGFAAKDLEAFAARVEAAGGRVLDKSGADNASGFGHIFVADVEGNVLQVSQSQG